MGIQERSLEHTDMRQFVVVAALAAVAQGASCPDGWSKVEVNDAVECVYFGGLYEGVTKTDAEVLCAARGGHLVDMDESRGPAKNNAIKSLLSDVVPSEPGRPGMQWDTQRCNGMTGCGTSPTTGTARTASPSSRTR